MKRMNSGTRSVRKFSHSGLQLAALLLTGGTRLSPRTTEK
jgi:hypothetical protein